MIVVYVLSTSLASVYIIHQRLRITRVIAEYVSGGSPCLDRQVLLILPCMRQLSGLAHEYTAMEVLGPIQLIGRRRVEYPLVRDTVTWYVWDLTI